MAGSDKELLTKQLAVYFIMGSNNCRGIDPVSLLRSAIAGGITMFQYREKGQGALTGAWRLQLAARLRELCREHAVPFIVNDEVELALALDADGMHIGQEDQAAAEVRKRIGPDRILGVSAHNAEEALAAVEQGADYLGVGPIYPTATKEDARAATGLRALSDIRATGITLPIVGIGGITAENTAAVVSAGADGVSVITAISHATDVASAAHQLALAVQAGRARR